MPSEQTDPQRPGGRDGHAWASSQPLGVAESGDVLIAQIVLAVRAGDDPALRLLLARLARVADVAILLRLRQRLYEDVPG